MPESPLAKKMKLKPGLRAAVINPPAGYIVELHPLPDGVTLSNQMDGQFDWVQIFVKDKVELNQLFPQVVGALKPQSLLWISYPKGSSGIQTDLTRDKGWDIVQKADLKWVTLISINETWSAFSLRPYKPGEKRGSFR